MRQARADQWDFVTVMVMAVFFCTVLVYSEPVAFFAAFVTFVIFRPRRRRMLRPARLFQRALTKKPRMPRSRFAR